MNRYLADLTELVTRYRVAQRRLPAARTKRYLADLAELLTRADERLLPILEAMIEHSDGRLAAMMEQLLRRASSDQPPRSRAAIWVTRRRQSACERRSAYSDAGSVGAFCSKITSPASS